MPTLVLPDVPRKRRRRNTLIQVVLILGLVLPPATLWFLFEEGGIYAGRPLVVRAATPADPVLPVRFGPGPRPTSRTVAIVEGGFPKRTWLEATLFLVRDDGVTEVAGTRASRYSGTHRGGPRWATGRFVVALGEATRPGGRVTWVDMRGGSGGGGWSEVVHNVTPGVRETFTGQIDAGETVLLHVEGDRAFVASREMTVEEFARANDGNFLVVTLKRH